MPGKGNALLDRIREVRKLEESAGPERGWRMLPIVTYGRKQWFFDQRLSQLRDIRNPHEWMDFNESEMACFMKRVKGKPPDKGIFLFFIRWRCYQGSWLTAPPPAKLINEGGQEYPKRFISGAVIFLGYSENIKHIGLIGFSRLDFSIFEVRV
jgi:hypothetical protein